MFHVFAIMLNVFGVIANALPLAYSTASRPGISVLMLCCNCIAVGVIAAFSFRIDGAETMTDTQSAPKTAKPMSGTVSPAGILVPDLTCPGIDEAIALTNDEALKAALERVRFENSNMRYSIWHHIEEIKELRAAASPRLAGSGEPVAWNCYDKIFKSWIVCTSERLIEHRRQRPDLWDIVPLYPHPAPSKSVGWRDIATKPPFVECEERGLYIDSGGGLFYFKPTHWRPIPSQDAGGAE